MIKRYWNSKDVLNTDKCLAIKNWEPIASSALSEESSGR